jgi:hypothetical protein
MAGARGGDGGREKKEKAEPRIARGMTPASVSHETINISRLYLISRASGRFSRKARYCYDTIVARLRPRPLVTVIRAGAHMSIGVIFSQLPNGSDCQLQGGRLRPTPANKYPHVEECRLPGRTPVTCDSAHDTSTKGAYDTATR